MRNKNEMLFTKFGYVYSEKKDRRGGVQYYFDFDNELEVSVIKFEGSYGYAANLWELAVLYKGEISEPEGWLNYMDVFNILTEIKSRKTKDWNKRLKVTRN